jgi:hypothetical protein
MNASHQNSASNRPVAGGDHQRDPAYRAAIVDSANADVSQAIVSIDPLAGSAF